MTVTDVPTRPGGMSHEELLAEFPNLTEGDTRACLHLFAADRERKLATLPV